MAVKPNNRRSNKVLLVAAVLLAVACCTVLYVHFWQRSTQVNAHIFNPMSVLRGHRSDIWSVAFSPDGRLIASGSVDSSLRLWDRESATLIQDLRQPSGVTSVDFSPVGNSIATSAYDAKIRLWKLPEGRAGKELSGHSGTVWSVRFSPDGKNVASGGEDATVRIWDVESGRVLHMLRGHTRNIWDLAFSPDGSTLASGSFDNTIRIWNVHTGKMLRTLTAHTAAVISLAFSHNGGTLASTSDDGSIRLWNTRSWQPVAKFQVPEHNQASAFSPDDRLLVTSGRDKPALGELVQNFLKTSAANRGVSMRLWDVATGRLLQTFSTHADDVNDVDFSSDGNWIVSGSSDNTIILWKRPR